MTAASASTVSVGATEASPTAPPSVPRSVDLHDPLAVAGAVAAGLYQSSGGPDWSRLPSSVLTAHARRVFDAFVARSGRRWAAAPMTVFFLDPRAVPVVVQADVLRWRDDPGAPHADPSPHLVRLTMVLQPGERWSVDDIQIIS